MGKKLKLDIDISEFLQKAELFFQVDASAIEELVPYTDIIELKEGEFLFKKGDVSEYLYLVAKGRIDILSGDLLDRLTRIAAVEAFGCVGEIGSISGFPRTGHARAAEDSVLVRLPRKRFITVKKAYPEVDRYMDHLILKRLPALKSISDSFLKYLDNKDFSRLQDSLEWIRIQGGEYLFRQGDPGDSFYITISGRLEVIVENKGEAKRVAELVLGDPVGEMALISGGTRSASVRAVRDTQLIRINSDQFDDIFCSSPGVTRSIMSFLVERIEAANKPTADLSHLRTIAILPIFPLSRPAVSRIVSAINENLDAVVLSAETVKASVGAEAFQSIADLDSAEVSLVLEWLNNHESKGKLVIYECDLAATAWTRCCLRQADKILLIADAESDPSLTPVEVSLMLKGLLKDHERTELVLLHKNSGLQHANTSAWLANRYLADFHHARLESEEDFHRLGRIITGRSIGLVLSGGGARGFAHIGVIHALQEEGIEIDFVGGTSIGSIVGATFAIGMDPKAMTEATYQEFVKKKPAKAYTLPLISVISDHRINNGLQNWLGKFQIEDLLIKFFCVSCNITQARPEIHLSGSLWKGVRASLALPGIFPPHFLKGQLLVDGGILNNIPVDVMRHLWRCKIIAVDVGLHEDLRVDPDLDVCPGAGTILQRKLTRGKKAMKLPSIGDILFNTLLCSSQMHRNLAVEQADYVLTPDISQFSLLGFEKMKEIIAIGYKHAKNHMDEIKEAIQFSRETDQD